MDEQKWTDDKVEKLFKEMPDLKDSRSKEEILANLKKDERLKSETVSPLKRKKSWMPVIVAVAALLVLSVILPSMLNGDKSEMEKTMETSVESGDSEGQIPAASSDDMMRGMNEEAEANSIYAQASDGVSHIMMPEQLKGMHTLRIGLTHEATVIPVTFLISAAQIAEDFPEGEPDSVALYNQYAQELPETELGFDEYHPYEGELTSRGNLIYHRLPKGHPYDIASAALYVYENSIQTTFIDHKEVRVVDENEDVAQFDQVGSVEPIKLTGGKKQLPYYKYVLPSGDTYLLPDGGSTYETVEAALLGMKERPNDLVQLLVPQTIDYDVQLNDETAEIIFREPLDLSKIDARRATEMIEGFMLTAYNYDQVVKLENVVQKQFGKYDLTSVLPEPGIVNPVHFSRP